MHGGWHSRAHYAFTSLQCKLNEKQSSRLSGLALAPCGVGTQRIHEEDLKYESEHDLLKNLNSLAVTVFTLPASYLEIWYKDTKYVSGLMFD